MKPGFVQPYTAEAAIGKYRAVKKGAANGGALVATADTEVLMGMSTDVDTDSGDIVDVITLGPAMATAGGAITQGALLTAGAAGVVVAAAPTAGSNAAILGKALEDAASGDIFRVLVTLSSMQG